MIRDWLRTKRRIDRSLTVLSLGSLLFVVRVIGPGWSKGFPSFFPDSASYLKVAKLGPFNPSFWFTERPVGVPLVLWFSGFNTRMFILLQTLVFVFAIAFLCRTILQTIMWRPLAWLTCLAIAAIAIQPRFGLWNLEVLSESLGMSLSLIALTCWLRVSQSPTETNIRWATTATVAWALVRDSHGIPVLILATCLLILAVRRSNSDLRRTFVKCGAVLLITFSYISLSQAVSDRNQYPLMNNVGLRILPDQDMKSSFTDRGMPMSQTLNERSGRNTWDDGEVFLRSPELAEFRDWVNGSGQTDQLLSLALDAPFWLDVMDRELPGALTYDFHDYDRFATLDRLPARVFGFDSPRTQTQLVLWLVSALIALVLMIVLPNSRRPAFIMSIGLVAILFEVYTSISGDAVEVQRHLVGPLLRLFVVVILSIALGLDAFFQSSTPPRITEEDMEHPRRKVGLGSAISSSAFGIVVLGAFFALEHRSQDFDPQYTKTIVERAAKFGGTYYQNGIHNKGPFETILYDSARIFTSQGNYWFGISLYILLISTCLALAAASLVRIVGGSRTIAMTAALATFLHFSISSSDYAGVIYSRNMTTCMLTAVFAWSWWPRAWSNQKRADWSFLASFVILGLAVQTLLTTIFAALVVGTALIVHRSRSTRFSHPVMLSLATFMTTVLSAPAWYLLRGSIKEFWSGWWTYAGFMSAGTGRSLMNQIGLGWNQLIGYYQDRPILLLLIAIFVFTTWMFWTSLPTFQKVMNVALVLWFASGWIELILGQRYSSHYFSVIAVPTVLMISVLASQLGILAVNRQQLPKSISDGPTLAKYLLPVGATVLILFSQCSDLYRAGIEKMGSFTTFGNHEEQKIAAQGGEGRTARAVLDLVSGPSDPLLAWTMYPWSYLEHERVPATRFSWKSFMIGEIYLGRTSEKFVLPETWKWFAEDIEESQPRAYLRPKEIVVQNAPTFANYVAQEFALAYDGNAVEVSIAKDDWARITEVPQSSLGVDEDSIFTGASPFPLSYQNCVRIAGSLTSTDSTNDFGVIFNFVDPNQDYENVHLSLSLTRAASSSDTVEFAAKDVQTANSNTVDFLLVKGTRSAVLIVDGAIVAGTRLRSTVDISVSAASGTPKLSGLTIDTSPSLEGCSNS